MQYSPKLKKAMSQIEKILKENDITGCVFLHTPGFSEHLYHLFASYSAATVTPQGIRIKIKESDIGREKARELAEGTYNMLHHFAALMGPAALHIMQLEEIVQKQLGGEPGSGTGYTSGDQQNN